LDLDPQLLLRCKAGDAGALGEIYDLYGGSVYRLARSLLPQAADAEDAVQEVFLRLFRKVGQFEGRSRFSTWIYRMTVNTCLNRRRAAAAPAQSIADLAEDALPAAVEPGPWERAAVAEDGERLRALLHRLPQEARVVLVLRELEGLSYREIAEVLGVPEGTVMSRLARARRRFAGVLGLTAWPPTEPVGHPPQPVNRTTQPR